MLFQVAKLIHIMKTTPILYIDRDDFSSRGAEQFACA